MLRQIRGKLMAKTCKYCGAEGLQWKEIEFGSEKFRLVEPSGEPHDCAEFHSRKRFNVNSANRSRNSLASQINEWARRWGDTLPVRAIDELDVILDAASVISTSDHP